MPDMLVRLYDLPDQSTLERRLEEEGVVIRLGMAYEKRRVADWVFGVWGSGWASECDAAFCRSPISCLVATEAGRVVGFACYDTTCKGFFGPTGVAESARGRGIGTALLFACLRAMGAQGYAYAVIGRVGPKEFYARTLGATEIPGSEESVYRDLLRKESE